ncbi:molybdate ABC transporter substrate-binding protein [Anaerotruncus colihominis]|uniref:Molybdate ABC transporter substrate-binding protein n=2 Tax=Anaerotruncus colihominis TaxID=169435 RepID=A0A845SU01_9FIRM|nr:molybdate ABC transporter substrate-binding protein [Anaerotruncus colihominis]MCR2025463.1 molybdate ABC transporter substrate-binding protein [Anaerotruncus colihominis]NDO37910.1 molybdate ABC transporter substrate-binding protein [Anaerotruncus colihominis]
MKKAVLAGFMALVTAAALGGCGMKQASGTSSQAPAAASSTASSSQAQTDKEPVTILVAAAASLEYSYTEQLIPMFQDQYPWITVEGTYDSSGKLQTQIEEGLEADVFMSAAMKQMNALNDEGLMASDSIVELLENKIVLIEPAGSEKFSAFEDIASADMVAIGDPESVPAGQYAKEALTNLELWDAVSAKMSLGTNVTEVLNWIAEGSADAGVVYATDAATTDKVRVVAQAPDGSLAEKVIYPVGVAANSAHPEEAKLFADFLASDEALAVFEEYGFSPNV